MPNYTPPAHDAVDFALVEYIPPAINAVNFELGATDIGLLFNINHAVAFVRAANIRVRKNGVWVTYNKMKTYRGGEWVETNFTE